MKTLKTLVSLFLIAGCTSTASANDDKTVIWECEFEKVYADLCLKKDDYCVPKNNNMDIYIYMKNKEFFLDTPGTTFPVRKISNPVHNSVSYVSDFSRDNIHLISIFADQSAAMTSHTFLNSAVSIASLGTCDAPDSTQ